MWVHIHTAGDDHVLCAVTNEEKTFFVHLAYVTDREELSSVSTLGLLFVIFVLKRRTIGPDVDVANRVRRQFVPVIVKDFDCDSANRAPNRAGVLFPLVWLGNCGCTFHATVGLPNNRTPPGKHLLLYFKWARRRRVADRVQA